MHFPQIYCHDGSKGSTNQNADEEAVDQAETS